MDDFTADDIAQIEAIIAADEAKSKPAGQMGADDLMAAPDQSQQYRDAFVNDVNGAVSKVGETVDKVVPGLTHGLADTAKSLKETVMGKPKVQALQAVEIVNGVKYVLTNGKYVKAK